MGRLDNKVAIVTGGSMGIGRSTSCLFAQEGAKVVVASRSEAAGREVADEIRSKGGDGMWVKLDVSQESDWQDVIRQTLDAYGKLNVLVNNAGIVVGHDIEGTTLDEWNRVMAVNATGTFLGMKYAIAPMTASGEDCSIINHSSIVGLVAEAFNFAYCASKGAVTVMTKSAALAMCEKLRDTDYRIRVNSVHPAYVHTDMVDNEARDLGIPPEEYIKSADALHPIGFTGQPIDVAYMDLYLASDESRFVTGAALSIDGGFTAQ